MGLFKTPVREQIIKDKEILSDRYIPKKIVGRDKKMEEMEYHLSYLFKNNPSLSNLFVYGRSGVGKSLIVNYVLDELEKEAKEKGIPLKIVRIKGSDFGTKFEILKTIYLQLTNSKNLPPRYSPDIYNSILEYLTTKSTLLIIFIDEIHEIRDSELNKVIYRISRINEDLRDYKSRILREDISSTTGYIFISNDPNISTNLQPNTRSALYSENVVFEKYTLDELERILKERIKEGALYKKAIDNECINLISAMAVKEGGDARYGLLLLKTSSISSEKKGMTKLTTEIIKDTNIYLRKNILKEIIMDLPALDLEVLYHIYRLFKQKAEITTGTVYQNYLFENKDNPVTLSRISQVISELEKNNIIYITSTKSKRGRTRRMTIDETEDVIGNVLRDKGFFS